MRMVTNRDMGKVVGERTEFNNSKRSCFARWEDVSGERMYIVFSYGVHWPLYIFHESTSTWYGNETRYSAPTTRRHSTLACPRSSNIKWLDVDDMIDIATFGLVGTIQRKFRKASGVAAGWAA